MIPISKLLFPINQKVEEKRGRYSTFTVFLWSALWICYKACWFPTFEANPLCLITVSRVKCYLQLKLGTEWWVLFFLEGYSSFYTHVTPTHGLKEQQQQQKNPLRLFACWYAGQLPVTVNEAAMEE